MAEELHVKNGLLNMRESMPGKIELVEKRLQEYIGSTPGRVSVFFKTGAGHLLLMNDL